MSCRAYLKGDLTKNKGGIGLLQILQKERLVISYDNQVLLGIISQSVPHLSPSKKGHPLLHFDKKRTYLDIQLKR